MVRDDCKDHETLQNCIHVSTTENVDFTSNEEHHLESHETPIPTQGVEQNKGPQEAGENNFLHISHETPLVTTQGMENLKNLQTSNRTEWSSSPMTESKETVTLETDLRLNLSTVMEHVANVTPTTHSSLPTDQDGPPERVRKIIHFSATVGQLESLTPQSIGLQLTEKHPGTSLSVKTEEMTAQPELAAPQKKHQPQPAEQMAAAPSSEPTNFNLWDFEDTDDIIFCSHLVRLNEIPKAALVAMMRCKLENTQDQNSISKFRECLEAAGPQVVNVTKEHLLVFPDYHPHYPACQPTRPNTVCVLRYEGTENVNRHGHTTCLIPINEDPGEHAAQDVLAALSVKHCPAKTLSRNSPIHKGTKVKKFERGVNSECELKQEIVLKSVQFNVKFVTASGTVVVSFCLAFLIYSFYIAEQKQFILLYYIAVAIANLTFVSALNYKFELPVEWIHQDVTPKKSVTCIFTHAMEIWLNSFVACMTCLISIERYLAMALPFFMHKRSALRNIRNIVVMLVSTAAVAIIVVLVVWKTSSFCNSSIELVQPKIVTIFHLCSFSCAWIVNLGFGIAGTYEITKIWSRRRNMGVPAEQGKQLVRRRSAILLLLDAVFFILTSLPDITFAWLNIIETQEKNQSRLVSGYFEFLLVARVAFCMSNSIFYVFVGGCKIGICK